MFFDGKWIQNLQNQLANDYSFPIHHGKEEKLGSVLLPLIWDIDHWSLLFTRRTEEVYSHKGEVSFPGGSVEENDGNFKETALRETWEEIGIPENQIQVLGNLKAVTTISNYYLLPIVAFVSWPTPLKANSKEVMRIFSIPIEWLADDANWRESEWLAPNGMKRNVIHYELFDGEHLWGITARITLDLINRIKQKDGGH